MKTALALSAAALALLSASVSAHAAPSFNSDTLTVGRTTAGLNESDEPPGQVEISGTVLTEFGIAGTHTVTLTDPGTNNISDIVSATISSCLDAFCLAVTLTSDVETPLLSTGDASFAETSAHLSVAGCVGPMSTLRNGNCTSASAPIATAPSASLSRNPASE